MSIKVLHTLLCLGSAGKVVRLALEYRSAKYVNYAWILIFKLSALIIFETVVNLWLSHYGLVLE